MDINSPIDATAARLHSLGLRPDQVERHIAGLAAAAAWRASSEVRRNRMVAMARRPEYGRPWVEPKRQRLVLTPTQVEALLVILRDGPEPGSLWRWQARPPADRNSAWLWDALTNPSVGISEAAFPDKIFATTNVIHQLQRLGLIEPHIARIRRASGGWCQFRFIRVVGEAPTPAKVHRERLPMPPTPAPRERLLPAKPMVRERLHVARRADFLAAQAETPPAPALGAPASQMPA